MSKTLILISSIIGTVAGQVLAQPPVYHESVPIPTLTNVHYGAHERQVLDFWKAPAASAERPAPSVFYIHGGSWKTGSKEIIHGNLDVKALLKAGISVVAINYRYVSQASELGITPPVKAPLEDAARALQFVRSKAEEWNVDASRIGGAGESAGGCSILWLAYHDDMADPKSNDPVARESTRLFCAGVRVPQTSLDPRQMKAWLEQISYGGHAFGVENRRFFESRERLLPWIKAYSPYAHVSADDPPVSLFYDKNLEGNLHAHSPQFGFHLQKRCQELGIPCEVLYDRAPGYRQNEATFFLVKTLNAPPSEDPMEYNIPAYNDQLPTFNTGTRLVFLGDSITDMNRGRNERDRNHYLGHSFVFMLAGRLGVAMPEAQLDFYNRGISGNTVAALRRRWQKDAIEMLPDVLTILIGTNDVGKGVKPDAFETDYRAILEASRKANPELKIILLDPFVLQAGGLKDDRAWRSRRTATDQLRSVVAQLAAEFDAVHIKLQDIFDAAAAAVSPAHWMWDGVHPLPQGHELIASHWLEAVSAGWPREGEAANTAFSPERYDVVWDSPSNDQSGSMPLGNGSTGLNAWIEHNGDLVFYISRTDSWGGNGRLLKLGRVRITLDPAPSTDDFLQTLSLVDGTLKARCGDTDIRLWVDANHPVIHAEISGAKPSTASAAVELWRNGNDTDTVLENLEGQIGWYHRNVYSADPAKLAETQGLGNFKRTDPLLHRTFGAVIKAAGAQRIDDTHLRSTSAKTHRFDIHVAAKHPATPDEWLATLAQTIAETESKSFKNRRAAHEAWWNSFWQRSWIHATPGSAKTAKKSLVPANSLNFRLGIDPNGGNKLSGGIGRTTLLKRALSNSEIKKLAKSQSGAHDVSPDDILFSGVPALHSEIKDSATWTNTPALTAELWVRQDTAGSMRILDKTTPGSSEGFLLDTHPQNSLRLIVGDGHFSASDCLKAGQWHHVAVVLDADARRVELYLDGKQVAGRDREESREETYVVSRAYALQRYINACAARGAYPIKFNGSIFTVAHEGKPHDADYRQWGPAYWWQNTRMPYMGMCTSGDVEMTDSLYKMYCQDLLEYHKHRAKIHTGHAGLYIPETMHFYGNHRANDYGKIPFAERTDKLQESPWHKWEWVAGLELSFMMFDRYEHTLDETFLKETILPFTHEVLVFFDLHYETGPGGKLVMHPSQALETWWECTNPMPEVAGLHAVIDRLLALPDALSDPKMRAYWTELKSKVPDLPTRDVDGTQMFAPAAKFANCRNSEVPELYAVYPFRLSSFEQENAQLGIAALNNRGPKGYQGWRQDDIFMAYLGLTEQAREYVVDRASTKHDGSRFPAFWGPNMDWVPDQTHGGVLMKAFQSMLMQTDGKKIFLQPAWPNDWNAEFKLHAPYKTVIEGRVENGKLVDLNVTPEARRKDVISEMTSTKTPMTIDEKTMKK